MCYETNITFQDRIDREEPVLDLIIFLPVATFFSHRNEQMSVPMIKY